MAIVEVAIVAIVEVATFQDFLTLIELEEGTSKALGSFGKALGSSG